MKKKAILRPLSAAMDDSYSISELYAVFESEAFGRPRRMDVPLLRETRTSHVSCLTKEEWERAKCRQK